MLLVLLPDLPAFIFLLSFNYHFWVKTPQQALHWRYTLHGTKEEIKSVERVSLLKTKTSLETGGVELAAWFTPG